jgi:threonine dehydrogenase-like Zn-dependent dehydrogenase
LRALLEDVKSGRVAAYDVPAPELQAGGILVRTAFSAISSGTEKATVEAGRKSLLGKALARPDLVKQVLEYAQSNGIAAARQKVQARLDTLSALGYSCSGLVLQSSAAGFQPGDRVACAGGGYASHCEINFVPANLAVLVPDNVDLEAASLTTIGAIAVQGVRQANVTFGETVAVIGVGLVGVLAIQVLRAAGCRVVAIDLSNERAAQATSLGAHLGLSTSDPGLAGAVASFSRYGVDAALITAATKSADPLELAAKLLRDRGRISVIGDVGMGVSRANMYGKEISLAMSRSYGPGRYDPRYEEGGQDYPIGFVRWTERRNMEAFLDLLSSGSHQVGPLLAHRFSVEEGGKAYAAIEAGAYTAIIDYHAPGDVLAAAKPPLPITVQTPPKEKVRDHLSPSSFLRRGGAGICCHQHGRGRRIGQRWFWFQQRASALRTARQPQCGRGIYPYPAQQPRGLCAERPGAR